MSGEQEDVSSHPLVIVRRRRNVDEPHHGGVWKIAYADFMTAMMAFFLVMWLINAADKKTIVQVAAYFNPMRLTERVATPKGLEDLTEAEPKPSDQKGNRGFEKQGEQKKKLQADEKSKEKTGEAVDEAAQKLSPAAGGKSEEALQEQALFDNPGDLLEKLADEAKAKQRAADSNPADGIPKDPFDRLNRMAGKAQPALKLAPETEPSAAGKIPEAIKQPQPAPPKAEEATKQALSGPANIEASSKQDPNAPAKLDEPSKHATSEEIKVAKLREQDVAAKKLEAEIGNAVSQISKELPHVEVKATSEGLLVSLTDDANFGMFEVGSAKPRPELVVAMSKIGGVLKSLSGKIFVRGHTDSRRYKSGVYDNWRLSAARAQMAYYMLVRGGISESSVVAIEGRADRDPKVPTDTEAAQNRRIDILIKEDKQ
jgi:chemotaxis protein MotB